jgi:hypothetical protein
MNIVFIRGNRATESSFNFIRSHIAGHPEMMLGYEAPRDFIAIMKT